ncbi:hypothetical protein FOCC_FOCC016105 [Frankliniella occidentalis]|nr:hypothetical protein FOCC_FOCC016105 [Frankliniella occidentalis]
MDGFGDNFDQADVDPAAEFIAREQNELAGLDDDITPAAPAVSGAVLTNAQVPVDTPDIKTAPFEFEDSLDQASQDSDAPSENQFGSAETAEEETPSPAHRPTVVREEPEKIKKWREEQKLRLEEKDANEEKKREEWHEAAKKELEEWYRHHDELIAKTRAANRYVDIFIILKKYLIYLIFILNNYLLHMLRLTWNAEKQFVADDDEIEPGTEWERIAKHCDFNPKASKGSKDVSRMRSIILQLKQNPLPVNGFGNKRS